MIQLQLNELIKKLGISQKAFGEGIGIKPAFVNDVLNGRARGFSSETLTAIQKTYKVNLNWLLTGDGEMFITPSDFKDGKVSYTAISDINEITRTKWFKNLTKEQRDIITNCSAVKDKDILKKVSVIISRQAAKEEGDRELEELDRGLQEK